MSSPAWKPCPCGGDTVPPGSQPCTFANPCPYAESHGYAPMPFLSDQPHGLYQFPTLKPPAATQREQLAFMGKYIADWAERQAKRREAETLLCVMRALPWPLRWLVAYPRALALYLRLPIAGAALDRLCGHEVHSSWTADTTATPPRPAAPPEPPVPPIHRPVS